MHVYGKNPRTIIKWSYYMGHRKYLGSKVCAPLEWEYK